VATYASTADLLDYVIDNRAAWRTLRNADDEQLERLVERGERAVDLVLGAAWPRDPATGLRLNPTTLTQAQRDAVSRAVCAYVEWLVLVGAAVEAGDSVEAPATLAVLQPAARQPPKIVAELAGYGLLKRSATVQPDPAPPPGHPWYEIEERALSEG
jgi:hypothetical protein